jgi:phosphoribosyl 1,2-cyclic phosphodiesterase
VEVRSSSRECLIIDAGTGLRELGRRLAQQQIAGSSSHYHFVLSHVHWDHIQGLPFFEPAYIEGTTISMYALRAAAEELQQVIGGITRHEYFPMPLEAVPADFEFHEVRPGRPIEILDFEIRPLALNHPFGAVGYVIAADDTSLAYVSDTAPFTDVLHKQHFLPGMPELTADDRERLGELRAALVEGLRGVDTVIYDTHFLPEEYLRFPHWGHSTPDHALDVCTGIGVRRLVLYHHAPAHGDDLMDEIARTYASRGKERGIEVITAHELMKLRIGAEEGGA